jgi:hypothetical protein
MTDMHSDPKLQAGLMIAEPLEETKNHDTSLASENYCLQWQQGEDANFAAVQSFSLSIQSRFLA